LGKRPNNRNKPSAKSQGAGSESGPRIIAARIICQVADGGSLSDVLVERLQGVPPKDRALVQELCYGVLRWWLRLHWVANSLLQKPLKRRDRDLEALVLIGIYQLLYMRIPPHAAVAETVEGTRGLGKSWASGLVNGVLRSLIRNQDDLLNSISEDISAELSFPQWLLDSIQQAWPRKWRAILDAANGRPPMSLRVNLKRCSRKEYFEMLQAEAIVAKPMPDVASGLVLDRPRDVFELPGFKDGLVSVQDGGAQLAAGLMDLMPGQKVLDLCAAPGGKTCHILEAASDDISMTAVDLKTERMQRVRENLDRLGLKATLFTGDAAEPSGVWTETEYDRILLDVPCSATGVIRRHPDIKLLRRPNDIKALADLQQRILQSAWALLRPGGVLLYATCSLLPQENEGRIKHFLSNNPAVVELPIDVSWGHARSFGRQTLPGEGSMDGFFYALLQKQ